MNLLKSCKLCSSISIFGIAILLLVFVLRNKIREVNLLYKDDFELVTQVRWLIDSQKDIKEKVLTGGGKAIIVHQSLINALETGNTSHIFPIPLNERRRTVIFSSWRSGSTFIGDVFNTLPGNYYHYEPFNYRGVTQIKTNEENINHVKDLLRCNFTSTTTFKHVNNSGHWHYNANLQKYCTKDQWPICRTASFREAYCHIFPTQNMKLVRARVTIAGPLLEDPELGVNVLLQVRDPRAVHLSRKNLGGCNLYPDCYDIKKYCEYMIEDYKNAKPLLEKYPKSFKVLRFEELALNPYEIVKELFQQFGYEFDDRIQTFLDTHTKEKKGNQYSTFRDSKVVVSRWMNELNMTEVETVQNKCSEAMKLWGYKLIEDQSQLNPEDFDPVDTYSI